MITSILFISGSEVFIVLLVVLLLFGSKKIPELAKGLGKGMKEFKRATEDIKKELHESTSEFRQSANEIRRDLDSVKGKLEEETKDIHKGIDDGLDPSISPYDSGNPYDSGIPGTVAAGKAATEQKGKTDVTPEPSHKTGDTRTPFKKDKIANAAGRKTGGNVKKGNLAEMKRPPDIAGNAGKTVESGKNIKAVKIVKPGNSKPGTGKKSGVASAKTIEKKSFRKGNVNSAGKAKTGGNPE